MTYETCCFITVLICVSQIRYEFIICYYLDSVCCCLVAKSYSTLLPPHGLQLLCPWDFSRKNTGVSCHFLLQGIFPMQGWNPVSSIGRCILYHRTREAHGLQIAYSYVFIYFQFCLFLLILNSFYICILYFCQFKMSKYFFHFCLLVFSAVSFMKQKSIILIQSTSLIFFT